MHRLRIATWATLAGVGLTLGCASSRNTCNCCECCCSTARAPFWQRCGSRRECCPAACPCSGYGAAGAPCTTCSSCGGGAVGTLMGNEGPLLDDPSALGATHGGLGAAPLSPAPLSPAPVTTLPGGGVPPLGQPTLPIAPTPRLDQPPLAPLAQPVPTEPSSRRRLTGRS